MGVIISVVQSCDPAQREGAMIEEKPTWQRAVMVIAGVALITSLYYGKTVLVTLLVSVLVAFVLEPAVEVLEKIRVPRSYGALIALLLVTICLYGLSHYSVLRTVEFIEDLPQYSQNLQATLAKAREQVHKLEKIQQVLLPESAEDGSVVKVKQVDPSLSAGLAASSISAGELVVWIT